MWHSHRPKTADQIQSKVSFSDSSKSDSDKRDRPSSASASHSSSPRPSSAQRSWVDARSWQRVNRQSEALWQYAPLAGTPPVLN